MQTNKNDGYLFTWIFKLLVMLVEHERVLYVLYGKGDIFMTLTDSVYIVGISMFILFG